VEVTIAGTKWWQQLLWHEQVRREALRLQLHPAGNKRRMLIVVTRTTGSVCLYQSCYRHLPEDAVIAAQKKQRSTAQTVTVQYSACANVQSDVQSTTVREATA
jgi:hypothetical protein